DAFVENGKVLVEIRSSEHGNTDVLGTYSNGTITFTWTVEDLAGPDNIIGTPDDHADICGTTTVAYNITVTHGNNPPTGQLAEVSNAGTNKFGFGVVNENGAHHDVCDNGGVPQAALALSKDTVCPVDGDSINGGTILAGKSVEWVYTLTNTGDAG